MKSVTTVTWTQESLEINDYIYVSGLGIGKVVGVNQKTKVLDGKIVESNHRKVRFMRRSSLIRVSFISEEYSILNYIPATTDQINQYKKEFKNYVKQFGEGEIIK
ncbi:hypothetical protein ACWN8V_06745 [Vagococcus elongatus]|uniref:Uncharacterized protein n=1 Tax=Vagococcus elongatus TaxID=180344 RepID=A0A430AW02_9ENTE|nr:hypothetical protein [Vagococcus elongatus]RSU12231.1 hypothetical protein CBF29_06435 [Vagococcus elongatus]